MQNQFKEITVPCPFVRLAGVFPHLGTRVAKSTLPRRASAVKVTITILSRSSGFQFLKLRSGAQVVRAWLNNAFSSDSAISDLLGSS
ncbi:hypothetical protein Trisim1_011638 [Trichoderma cf. simile WF8]